VKKRMVMGVDEDEDERPVWEMVAAGVFKQGVWAEGEGSERPGVLRHA
jgi:hypothetical protein